MALFGRKKPRISLQDALAAKPARMAEAEVEPKDDGGAAVRVRLRKARFLGRLIRMPEGATKTFEFDPIGRLVWDACDGKTSVRKIIRAVASHCRISEREAQVSTVAFLQMLTRKGLVALHVGDAGAGADGGGDASHGFEVVRKP
ncbi:MAG TPA: PqqD family protein [Tepidisphaeraceae bacterium]|nr:PqqD family protein [Tepidisphaeraceae bacterium]